MTPKSQMQSSNRPFSFATTTHPIISLKRIAWVAWATAILALMLRYTAGGIHRVYAFNDYMLAGSHWVQGAYLYGNWRGFIYSPVIAAFFVPLAILPAAIAYILWLLLNLLVFFGGLAALLEANIIPASQT